MTAKLVVDERMKKKEAIEKEKEAMKVKASRRLLMDTMVMLINF